MKKFILTVMACVGMLSANAQTPVLSIENLKHEPGVGGSFDVCLNSEENTFASYQMDVFMPIGVTLSTKKSQRIQAGEAAAEAVDKETWNCDITANAGVTEKAPEGMTGFLAKGIDMDDTGQANLATKGGAVLFTVKYNATADIQKMTVRIENVVISTASGKADEIVKLGGISATTGITGITADKAEAANDGKFVENNRVVIKKAGVKYSTTGQVIK